MDFSPEYGETDPEFRLLAKDQKGRRYAWYVPRVELLGAVREAMDRHAKRQGLIWITVDLQTRHPDHSERWIAAEICSSVS